MSADLKIDEFEVLSKQPTLNIGTIGHVAHGKSTIVKSISGVHTVRFKSEMIRNITIKLGYANAKIYKCNRKGCPSPNNYTSTGSDVMDTVMCHCGSDMTLVRHVSFVDCPGHGVLMSTMMNGASVMDAALLLIAANEKFPQPQTLEHIAATEICQLKNLIVLQNKVDLVKETEAAQQYYEIREFMKDTANESAPIIPISAQLGYNMDVICQYLVTKIPQPVRDLKSSPRMQVIRSFDVNRPGQLPEDLKGGICGGSISRGVFRLHDEIEIRPGIIQKDDKGKIRCIPIVSQIISLFAEKNQLEYAIPGGLIGVGTNIDPVFTKGDHLVGHVMGIRGQLPDIYDELEVNYFLLKKIIGQETERVSKPSKLSVGEVLMINIQSMATAGKVSAIKGDMVKLSLQKPVCSEIGDKIAISRRIDKQFRLIGYGKITRAKTVPTDDTI